MSIGFVFRGQDKIEAEVKRLSRVKFDAACVKNVTQIHRRALAEGGTPVATGELRGSASMRKASDGAEFGYSKDYAPHVEYGHRTRGNGWVSGRNYLKNNVEKQRATFRDDVRKILK